jgi:hypothetical protein
MQKGIKLDLGYRRKIMVRLGLFFSLLFWGTSAFSNLINAIGITDVITGADMSGMMVRAIFEDSSRDRGVWQTLSTVDLPFLEGEGMSGAASGRRQDWTLYQQGYTLGNESEIDGDLLGAWTLYNNTGVDMSRLVITGLTGGIVFDTLFGQIDSLGGVGREFTPFSGSPDVTARYRLPIADELYGRMILNFDEPLSGDSGVMRFWADTDRITISSSVPEPSTYLLMGVGLLGMVLARRVKTLIN